MESDGRQFGLPHAAASDMLQAVGATDYKELLRAMSQMGGCPVGLWWLSADHVELVHESVGVELLLVGIRPPGVGSGDEADDHAGSLVAVGLNFARCADGTYAKVETPVFLIRALPENMPRGSVQSLASCTSKLYPHMKQQAAELAGCTSMAIQVDPDGQGLLLKYGYEVDPDVQGLLLKALELKYNRVVFPHCGPSKDSSSFMGEASQDELLEATPESTGLLEPSNLVARGLEEMQGLWSAEYGSHGPEVLLPFTIEGLKLIGDVNVPAGQVSFRVDAASSVLGRYNGHSVHTGEAQEGLIRNHQQGTWAVEARTYSS
eukprot:gene17061-23356_t